MTSRSFKSAFLALLMLTGCREDDTNDKIQNDRNEATIGKKRSANSAKMEADPCLQRKGNNWAHVGWRNCLEFLPSETMKGVWILDFEESSFIPNFRGIPKADNRDRFTIFLDIDLQAVERLSGTQLDSKSASATEVEFVGRRSKHAGSYYTGTSDYVVVVDHLISAKNLGPVPDPDWLPTKPAISPTDVM